MCFSDEEIQLAESFRENGLPWEPTAGHYVYDRTGFCPQPSPFQDKVYFILNYEYFMKKAGGVEQFKNIMTWLPTWKHARQILRNQGVTDAQVARQINESEAIESGTERLVLYEMIASALCRHA